VVIEVIDCADLVEAECATVDGITIVVELHVDVVAGEDAHAVDIVFMYGSKELGETSVFVEHVGGSIEMTILREHGFLLLVHNFGAQSEGVGYRLVMIEVPSRSQRGKSCVCLIHVGRRHDGLQLLLLTVDMVCLQAFVVVWVVVFSFPSVVAASTLSARLAAARPIIGVGKVWLASSRVVCWSAIGICSGRSA